MDRRYYELEDLRRSLAMLEPHAASGLDRERAMALVAELQNCVSRLEAVRDRLRAVADEV